MSNISLRVSETKLFKERKSLNIEFCWETSTDAVFSRSEDETKFGNNKYTNYTIDLLGEYYLIESFSTGVISVTELSKT